jgi:uncharacterized protein YbaR (Trm112 family)
MAMTDWTLDAKLGAQVTVDVCTACQAFWFDHLKSLQLSPGSTLKLMKYIGEHSTAAKPRLSEVLRCPRCAGPLTLTHDMARTVRFSYWRCANNHGHFIGFFDFLKEKNFIHPLSPQEIKELREKVQTVNCSSCGAPIDLEHNSECPFCHSPITMLDMKQQQQMLAQLKEAAEPRPVDPTLPLKLALAKQEVAALFPRDDAEWWNDARSGDLVQAGLNAVIRWFTK